MEQLNRLTLIIERDGILTLPLGRRFVRIRCMAGTLWITTDGNEDDLVLAPGDERSFRGRGKAVIQALRTSTARIDRPRTARARYEPALRYAGAEHGPA